MPSASEVESINKKKLKKRSVTQAILASIYSVPVDGVDIAWMWIVDGLTPILYGL